MVSIELTPEELVEAVVDWIDFHYADNRDLGNLPGWVIVVEGNEGELSIGTLRVIAKREVRR